MTTLLRKFLSYICVNSALNAYIPYGHVTCINDLWCHKNLCEGETYVKQKTVYLVLQHSVLNKV